MQKLTTHYQQLLGIPVSWAVDEVNLALENLRVKNSCQFYW
jgi:hypothetical protein